MFARFSGPFIHRPIYAWVMSIAIVLIGVVAILQFPVERVPCVSPPAVVVSARYPGANAAVVAETLAAPIESAVNGVEGMAYMSSRSCDDGGWELTVTFAEGTDADEAAARVQRRVDTVVPSLPDEVRRERVITEKRTAGLALMVNLIVRSSLQDNAYLSQTEAIGVRDALQRLPGVGRVEIFGGQAYGLQVWLDLPKMKARGVTVDEVVAAIREQNVPVAAGQIGGLPSPPDQVQRFSVGTLGRLSGIGQLEDIVVHTTDEGQLLRLKDIARVEVGAGGSRHEVELSRWPSVALGVYPDADAKVWKVARDVRRTMQRLAERFPEDVEHEIAFDASVFDTASLSGVLRSLAVAFVLMLLALQLLLKDLRAVFISAAILLVVVVATLGTSILLGLPISMVTLFAVLLAMGVVVCDVLVVIHHARRNMAAKRAAVPEDEALSVEEVTDLVEQTMETMEEEGLSGREAHEKVVEEATDPAFEDKRRCDALDQTMGEVAAPLVVSALALVAFVVPCVWLSGVLRAYYHDFALAFALGLGFSLLSALTLLPALCRVLLRPTKKRGKLSRAFDWMTDHSAWIYGGTIRIFVRFGIVGALLYALVVAWTWSELKQVSRGFVPREDQGYFVIEAQLPDGATLPRTRDVVRDMEAVLLKTGGIHQVISMAGYSALDDRSSPDVATCFVVLHPWQMRTAAELYASRIAQSAQRRLDQIPGAACRTYLPPPLCGFGNAGGLTVHLRDIDGAGLSELGRTAHRIASQAGIHPALEQIRGSFHADAPQFHLEIDRTKAKRLGVPLQNVFQSIQVCLGSIALDDVNLYGRLGRVRLHADPAFRRSIENLTLLEVRATDGRRIPLRALVEPRRTAGPNVLYRHNLAPSATITASPSPGYTLEEAVNAIEEVAAIALPPSIELQRSGIAYQQFEGEGRHAVTLLSLAAALAYLVLVAAMQSWLLPVAVILAVPLALLGASLATQAVALDVGVYSHFAVLLLVGLSVKNSVFFLDAAIRRRGDADSITDTTTEVAQARLPLVLIPGLAFALAMLPLALAAGAGAGAQRALGITVFGGVLTNTLLGVVFIPILYAVLQWMRETAAEDWINAWAEQRQLFIGLLSNLVGLAISRVRRRKRPRVFTVTGPIAPEKLGATLPHEHICINPIGARHVAHDHNYNPAKVFDRMVETLMILRRKGARTLIDGTTDGRGRDPKLLKRISEATKLQIITPTGLYGADGGRYLPSYAFSETPDQIADRWIGECRDGIGNSGIRPGYIKIGVGMSPLSDMDKKLVLAAAKTHLETGLTIASHTTHGDAAHEQIDILEAEGVDPMAWIWVHAQTESRRGVIVKAAERRGWVEFDGVNEATVEEHLELIHLMKKRGLISRVLISQNLHGYTVGEHGGGHIVPYFTMFKLVIPQLFRAGWNLEDVEQLTVVNPMRAFAARVRRG